jgi:heptosyltransferase-1
MSILVLRLGAMGDIVHALPAVASLKQSFPGEELIWVVKDRWTDLLEGNPSVDRLLKLSGSSLGFLRQLRNLRPRLAVDFQGLLQSAILGRLSRPEAFFGFDHAVAREPFASSFYTRATPVTGPHRIQRNLQLVVAAGAAATTDHSWLPAGRSEGELPLSPFVLASPFAGWAGKQWPLANYAEVATYLAAESIPLVMNISGDMRPHVQGLPNVHVHVSSIAGLIYATRQASAVLGVDSGPLHIAAALQKPGVAIYGPTDPAATGPYGGSMQVLRSPAVETTYERHKQIQESMRSISPRQVFAAIMHAIDAHPATSARTKT